MVILNLIILFLEKIKYNVRRQIIMILDGLKDFQIDSH